MIYYICVMEIINLIIKTINAVSSAITNLLKYKHVYKLLGIFTTRHFKPTAQKHKYAVLVAARNEETVIGNLVDSIRQQDYPSELVDIFVVADNCTDNTARIARELGAVCYERFDSEHRTKGFALQFLVECIRRDYGIDSYEGYFLFDADNLLKQDYITRMNESFDAGEKIVTSYRNTKNFGDNWISASYALHWLRTIINEHRARSVFHLATRIQGTGFLFASEIIEKGWNYTSLTEDRAFCADAVANGYKISFNNEAEFFDEQPTDIKIAMRQRIRWAKGHLQAFTETGPKLFSHIFVTHGAANKESKNASRFKQFINNIRLRFMSLDMLSIVYPRSLVSSFKKILIYILRVILIFNSSLILTNNFAPKIFRYPLNFFGVNPNEGSPSEIAALLALFTFAWTISTYLTGILNAAIIFLLERKRIAPMKLYRKIWFCMTFPIFDLIGKLSMIIALFIKVEWKPIPHNADIKIEDISKPKEHC